ncbi:MAG: hypothetical protein ABIO72_04980 [Patescibacteria group bacterium]
MIQVLIFFASVLLCACFAAILLLIGELWRVSFWGGVPSIFSTWAIVDAIISAKVLPRDGLILDLGAGNGWTLRRMWRSGMKGPFIGYEKEWWPWIVGTVWNSVTGAPIILKREDFLNAPIEDARGIYLFLFPSILSGLGGSIEQKAHHGIPVVSAEFAVPGWTPERTLEAKGITNKKAKVFCYRTP